MRSAAGPQRARTSAFRMPWCATTDLPETSAGNRRTDLHAPMMLSDLLESALALLHLVPVEVHSNGYGNAICADASFASAWSGVRYSSPDSRTRFNRQESST